MTYTGRAEVGGPAQVRELPWLVLSKLAVGPSNNNAYLLRCRSTGKQLMIDAAAEAGRLIDLIGSGGLDTVVTTHSHVDHWTALADVVAATGAQTVAHIIDADDIGVSTATRIEDGDVIRVGDVELRAIHLVGHTPGSIALLYDDPEGHDHLFTGDCLFPGGPGNTWGDAARFNSLMDGLESEVFGVLSDETWIYPGHGHDTTLGVERPQVSEWRARGW